ncbi:hypothetical protein IW150_001108 [Coemansia sp. RSA 2607]|nr:hypothetical protein IW150_001108 [Coemansia sp. RSA 2607]
MSNPLNKPSGKPTTSTPKSHPSNTMSGPPATRGVEKHSVQDGSESAEVPAVRSTAQLRDSQSDNDNWLAAVKHSIKEVRALLKCLLIASPDLGARTLPLRVLTSTPLRNLLTCNTSRVVSISAPSTLPWSCILTPWCSPVTAPSLLKNTFFKHHFEGYMHQIGQDYSVPLLGKDLSALLSYDACASDRSLVQVTTMLATGVRTVESVLSSADETFAAHLALAEKFYFVLNDLNVMLHRALGQISEICTQQLLKLGNAELADKPANNLLSTEEFVQTVNTQRSLRKSLAASISKSTTAS